MLDLMLEGTPNRLSAVLDEEDRKLLLEGGARRKPMSIGSINSSTPPTEMPTIPTIAAEDLVPDVLEEEEEFGFTQSSQGHRSQAYSLEPSRTFRSPDATLDLSRLALEVGVNQHPWATPRSSTPASPRASTPAHRTPTAIQIVTPPTPRRQTETEHVGDESILLATENVIRVGKGFESSRSFRGRQTPTSSASFYNGHQSSENIATRSSADKQSPETLGFSSMAHQSESMRAKKVANRRSSIFATLRGRQQAEMTGISSDTYFANDFGEVPPLPTLTLTPTNDPYAEHGMATGGQRSNTLTHRMKKAFLRVVSNPNGNRPATIGVAS